MELNKVLLGDCEKVLADYPDNFFDLIFTSPPYAGRRGAVEPDQYVEWFLPRAAQFLRVLKPTGTFILNIKERVVDGERHTYVLDLIKSLRGQGWLWTEEFCWHKRNCFPGRWPNRFRDAWERLLQFNKTKQFNMYQDAVMVPVGDWAKKRLSKLSENDQKRCESQVGSGFGKNIANWVGQDMVYPTNVVHFATECSNKAHSAAFPQNLPEWFIKLFTVEGDVVCDPFAGSCTTLKVAERLGRQYVGAEIDEQHCSWPK